MVSRRDKTKAKREKKKMRQQEEALCRLLMNYGNNPSPQRTDSAPTDSQLNTLITAMDKEFASVSEGTVVDIGCGHGVLLERLAALPNFKDQAGMLYFGIDYSDYHDEILTLARTHRMHRRVDVASIDEYAQIWKDSARIPSPYFVFVRNVLHELSFDATRDLLYTISENCPTGSLLVIQDLLVFPEAERGNVCWQPEQLKFLVHKCGFRVESACPIKTKSGSRWFNLLGRREDTLHLKPNKIYELIVKYRRQQWEEWSKANPLTCKGQDLSQEPVSVIDFDLQYAALTIQLLNAGASDVTALTKEQESLCACRNFARQLSSTARRCETHIENLKPIKHFKDRANSLDALQAFLSGPHSVTVITGPPLMGKTTLTKHVLATFEHGRIPCFLDLQTTTTVWNLIENLLSEMGVRFSNEILLRLKRLSFSSIESELESFISTQAANFVFSFDHWERITEPDGCLHDEDIKRLVLILAETNGTKLIITSRYDIDTSFIASHLEPTLQPPVGRFPREPHHVPNVLGAFLGWPSYPRELIQAIDRHPLMAVLAALYLKERGADALSENSFLTNLSEHLRSAILAKILNDQARPAIQALSMLRLPVPRSLLVGLSSHESVSEAEKLGLINPVPDLRRDDLVALLVPLRLQIENDADSEIFASNESIDENFSVIIGDNKYFHEKAARQFEKEFRLDGDGKWLREMYYHLVVGGNEDILRHFGNVFCSELSAAADYWFRTSKDFKRALWAYEKIRDYGYDKTHIRMRIASCKIRLNRVAEGEREFNLLLKQYPRRGFFSAYVDALLSASLYENALSKLEEFSQLDSEFPWTAGQYGRAYRGLQQHEKAIQAFGRQLRVNKEPVVFQSLAGAYHAWGDTANERKTLEEGLRQSPTSRRLKIAYAALLERIGKLEDAAKDLKILLERSPYDGWIILPLVKALARQGQQQEAELIWRKASGKICPDHMNVIIEAEIFAQKEEFASSISLLQSIIHDDEHSGGQRLELFYRWATRLGENEAGRQKAAEGLDEQISPAASNNVPLLVSKAKLALFAQKRDVAEDVLKKLRDLNPNLQELVRLEQEFENTF